MKKITILTSMLALAACGGGTSGLSTDQSNANITGMNSFVVVGGDNPTINPNSRSASTNGILQADGGTRYDLEDVTFKTIPTSGVIARLKFHTDDNGKVISVEYPDAQQLMDEHSGSDITVGQMMRKGDTNIFIERVVLDEEFGERAGQSVDIPTEYVSYAKKLGLKYSDFGVIRTDIAGTNIPELQVWDVIETPFAGGYNVKNINNTEMKNLAQDGDIVFSGLAKGRISYHDWNAGIGGADIAMEDGLNDEHATLTFAQDGGQTLAADFSNWAKIRVVKNAEDKNQIFVDSYIDPDSPYFMTDSPIVDDSVMDEYTIAFQTGYYGDNGTPAEGVGLVQYQHQYGNLIEVGDGQDYEHHVNLDLGFGGTRK